MTALTHAEAGPRVGYVRAYVAGTGATSALVGGAIVVFLSLAAFLAFKGVPVGGSSEGGGSLYLGSNAGAPEAAAAALAAAPGAVAAAPLPGAPVGFVPVTGVPPPGDGNPPGGHLAVIRAGDLPPECPPELPQCGGGGNPDAKRATTGTVKNVDETTGEVGLDTNLSGMTRGMTRPLDDTLNRTLNGVGGMVGQPHLGDRLGQAANELGNRLIGDQGLTGQLLGPG